MATDIQTGKPAKSPPRNYEKFVEGRLSRAIQRVRALDLATAGLGFLAITLAYGLGMALVDRWLELSPLARQFAFAGYLAACSAFLYLKLVIPLRRTINPYFAARQIESQIPQAKNSVVNWVDLRGEPLHAAFRHAIGRRAASDLSTVNLEQAIQSRPLYWLGWTTLVLLTLVLVLYVISPRQLQSLLKRAFAPFTEAPIATRTQITIRKPEEGNLVVPIGNAVSFSVWVDGRIPDSTKPEALKLLYRYGQSDPYEMRNLEAGESRRIWDTTLLASEVHNGFWYKFTGGDAETQEYRVSTRSAPLVASVDAVYHYRPYLKWKDHRSHDPNLQGLAGTKVSLTVHTNRRVQDGQMRFSDKTALAGALVPEDPEALRFQLILEKDANYQISFLSVTGERNGETRPYRIRVEHDAPPQVELTQPGRDIALPANGVLRLAGSASDDFGLAGLVLRLRAADEAVLLQPKPYRDGKQLLAGDGTPPLTLDYQDFVELQKLKRENGGPVTLQPGKRLEYWLEATDTCDYPEPHTSQSKRFFVTIGAPSQDPAQQKGEVQKAQSDQRRHDEKQDQQLKQEKQNQPQNEQGDQQSTSPSGQKDEKQGQQPQEEKQDQAQPQSDQQSKPASGQPDASAKPDGQNPANDEKQLQDKKQELDKLIQENEKKQSGNNQQPQQGSNSSEKPKDGNEQSAKQDQSNQGNGSKQQSQSSGNEKQQSGNNQQPQQGSNSSEKPKDGNEQSANQNQSNQGNGSKQQSQSSGNEKQQSGNNQQPQQGSNFSEKPKDGNEQSANQNQSNQGNGSRQKDQSGNGEKNKNDSGRGPENSAQQNLSGKDGQAKESSGRDQDQKSSPSDKNTGSDSGKNDSSNSKGGDKSTQQNSTAAPENSKSGEKRPQESQQNSQESNKNGSASERQPSPNGNPKGNEANSKQSSKPTGDKNGRPESTQQTPGNDATKSQQKKDDGTQKAQGDQKRNESSPAGDKNSDQQRPDQKQPGARGAENRSGVDSAKPDKSNPEPEKKKAGLKEPNENKESRARGNEENKTPGKDESSGTRPKEARDGDRQKQSQAEDKSEARKNSKGGSQQGKDEKEEQGDKNQKKGDKEGGKSQAPISSQLKGGEKQADGKPGSNGEKSKEKGATQQKGDQEGKASEQDSGGKSRPGQTSQDKAGNAPNDTNQQTSGQGRQDTSLSSKDGQKSGGKATSADNAAQSNDPNGHGNVSKDKGNQGDSNRLPGDRDPGVGEDKAPSGKNPPIRSKDKNSAPQENQQTGRGQTGEQRSSTKPDSGAGSSSEAIKKVAQKLAEDLRSSDPQKRAAAQEKLDELRRKLSDERARQGLDKAMGKPDTGQSQSGKESERGQGEKGNAPGQDQGSAGRQQSEEKSKDGSSQKSGDEPGKRPDPSSDKSGEGSAEGGDQKKDQGDQQGRPTDGPNGGTAGSGGLRAPERPGPARPQNRSSAAGSSERPPDQEAVPPFKPVPNRLTEMQLENFRKRVNKDILKQANMSEEDFQKFLKAYRAYLEKGAETSPKEHLAAPHTGNLTAPNQGVRQIDLGTKAKTGTAERTGPALPPPEFREAQKEFSRRLSEISSGRDQK
jgi:hypothetical protein